MFIKSFKLFESVKYDYEQIGISEWKGLIGKKRIGDPVSSDYSNVISWSKGERFSISRFLDKRGYEYINWGKVAGNYYYTFWDTQDVEEYWNGSPDREGTKVNWNWAIEYTDLRKKSLRIHKGESALIVSKIDDDWYLATYMNPYEGPSIPENYEYFKCDQIKGLFELIESIF